jgi:hypothetical protein
MRVVKMFEYISEEDMSSTQPRQQPQAQPQGTL